jgi:hypothetical protein
MYRSLLIAVCLWTAGCSGPSDPPDSGSGGAAGGASSRRDESLDVYEAVFRHQLKSFPPDAEAHLAIDDRDIPRELLDRLRHDWPNLRQVSEGSRDANLRVCAEGLKWDGRDAAELKVGYWFPTKFAGQARFGDHRLVRKGGRWVVESVTNETIGCG